MISARAGSIRSGWKPIFTVLAKVVQTKNITSHLVESSFTVCQIIFKEHFSVIIHAGGFVDYISCLTEFALMKSDDPVCENVIIGSIQLLQYCARHLLQLAEDNIEEMKLKSESLIFSEG